MKTVKKLLMVCLALCGVSVFAADESPVKSMHADVEFTASPDVNYRDHKELSVKNRPENKWLMVKVRYTMAAEKDFSAKVRYRKSSGMQIQLPGWLDNVELKVQVLFDTGAEVKQEKVYVLFSGKSVFRTVKCDGKEHLAVMFIPARMLDRYCSGWTTAKMNKNSFRVKAEMFYGGRELATAYRNVPGKNDTARGEEFEKLLNSVPKELRLPGTVLPRSRSPWALLAPDNYDLEVSEITGVAQE